MNANVPLSVVVIVSLVLLFLLIHTWVRLKKYSKMADAISLNSRDQTDNFHHIKIFPEEPILDSLSEPYLNPDHSLETFSELDETDVSKNKENDDRTLNDDLIVINVVAKYGTRFVSYDLLQAISATGMQYGAMNIFHYYLQKPFAQKTLFSLASATEPGDFDLNNIGELSCAGLTLFMNYRDIPNALDAFEMMIDTAEQLAEDLDGELLAGPKQPWNESIKQHYENKVREHAENY